jgi:hypothetical protein
MWNADDAPATLVYVGKGRIHVSIDETLLDALRVRASKLHCHQSDVITIALQRELSLELFDQTWEGRLGSLEHEPAGEHVQQARASVPETAGEPEAAQDDPAEVDQPSSVARDRPAVPWPGT